MKNSKQKSSKPLNIKNREQENKYGSPEFNYDDDRNLEK